MRARLEVLGPLLVLGGVWALLFTLDPFADEQVNDLFVSRGFAADFLDGLLPYRDVAFEYPPLAAPVLALSGVLGTDEDLYRIGLGLVMLICAAAVALLVGEIAARTGGDRRRAMYAAALAPLLVGAVVRNHFDLAAVALMLGALLALVAGRTKLGFLVLGLGALVKLFPLVAAPVALAWLVGRGERRAALAGGAVLAATLLVGAGTMVALSPSGAEHAVRYQLERPVQIESSQAIVLFALDGLGAGAEQRIDSHRSNGLEHPADDIIGVGFGLALLIVVAVLAVAAARRTRPRAGRPGEPRSPPETARVLVLASLAAVAALVALGPVLSPQFLAFVIPLCALALAWRMHLLAALSGAALLLTLVEFPSSYFDLVDRDSTAIALVAVRDAVLLGVALLAARAAFKRRAAPSGPGRGPSPPNPSVWRWATRSPGAAAAARSTSLSRRYPPLPRRR